MDRLRRQLTLQSQVSSLGAVTKAFLQPARLPLVIAGVALFAAVAWWADATIQETFETQLSGQLATIVGADVVALNQWRRTERSDAEGVMRSERVQRAVRAALAAGPFGLRQAGEELTLALKPHVEALGYDDYLLLSVGSGGELRPVAASRPLMARGGPAPGQGPLADWIRNIVREKKGLVSKPGPSQVPRPDGKGGFMKGVPTMGIGIPLTAEAEVLRSYTQDEAGREAAAVLAFNLDPTKEFSQILETARFGETGETYAFDAEGNMLSKSRFQEELVKLGLMDPDDPSAVLEVKVCDPGYRISEARPKPEEPGPLTVAVASAVADGDGSNVKGYRDYRGARVIGAWRWLDDFEIGVVTEVNYGEAYLPLVWLRSAVLALIGLAGATGLGLLGFMYVAAENEVALHKAEQAAEKMGQYTLDKKLGEGGMGAVYLARHALMRRPTAVKIISADDQSPDAIKRFEREVQTTCQLSNPHTIAVYDYGRTPEGKFFYAMEYLEGLTLGDLIEGIGPLPPARARYLLIQACESLAEAHSQGVVHRDIKPDNIFVATRGGLYDFVKVLDFGLVKRVGDAKSAQLTQAGTVVGTPLYMAPEQILDEPVEKPADVYALGAVGYHMLTGSPPFYAKHVFDVLNMHVNDAPELPSERLGQVLPERFEQLILRCLGKDRRERPGDAKALLNELRKLELEEDWDQAEAEQWWLTHGDEARSGTGDAAKDMTGMSWLAEDLVSKTKTAIVPGPSGEGASGEGASGSGAAVTKTGIVPGPDGSVPPRASDLGEIPEPPPGEETQDDMPEPTGLEA